MLIFLCINLAEPPFANRLYSLSLSNQEFNCDQKLTDSDLAIRALKTPTTNLKPSPDQHYSMGLLLWGSLSVKFLGLFPEEFFYRPFDLRGLCKTALASRFWPTNGLCFFLQAMLLLLGLAEMVVTLGNDVINLMLELFNMMNTYIASAKLDDWIRTHSGFGVRTFCVCGLKL